MIIVLTGPMTAGKTTIAKLLNRLIPDSIRFSASDYLKEISGSNDRKELQAIGSRLDEATMGQWISLKVKEIIKDYGVVIVDSVRCIEQLAPLQASFECLHVHLHVSDQEAARRWNRERSGDIIRYKIDPIESRVHDLARQANIVIDAGCVNPSSIAWTIMKRTGFVSSGSIDVIVGGQYGSEGKGHICSYIAPEYDVLVRGGGPNAGHTVYQEPKPIVLHHLPSGCVTNQHALVVLGPGATIRIPKLLEEMEKADFNADRLLIDGRAMIITDEMVAEEASVVKEIGSTGQGVGAAAAAKILKRSEGGAKTAKDYRELEKYVTDTYQLLRKCHDNGGKILVEGTQGSGLSLHHGPYPHVTSRDTCAAGAMSEIGLPIIDIARVYMVCRTYPIRVASPQDKTSGPMSSETDFTTISDKSGVPLEEIKATEITTTTRRVRRIAEWDWSLFQKSCFQNGVTDIALTFCDYLDWNNRRAKSFDDLTDETKKFIEQVEESSNIPVSLASVMFHHSGILDRRS